ncbi:hypothetical protein EMWEY_00029250, partial [Eimeria maxima]
MRGTPLSPCAPRVSLSWFPVAKGGWYRRLSLIGTLCVIFLFCFGVLISAVKSFVGSLFLSAGICLVLLLFLLYYLTLALTLPGSNRLFQWYMQQQLAADAAEELLQRLRTLELFLLHLLAAPVRSLSEEQKEAAILSAPPSCLHHSLCNNSNNSSNNGNSSSSSFSRPFPLLNTVEEVQQGALFALGDAAIKDTIADCYFMLSTHLRAFQALHLKADTLLRQERGAAASVTDTGRAAAAAAATATAAAATAAAATATAGNKELPGWHQQQLARCTLSWVEEALAFSCASLLSHLLNVSITPATAAPSSSPAAAAGAGAAGKGERYLLGAVLGLPSPAAGVGNEAASGNSSSSTSSSLLGSKKQEERLPLAGLQLATSADVFACAAALQQLHAVALLLLPFQGSHAQQQQQQRHEGPHLRMKVSFVLRLALLLFRYLVSPPLASMPLLQQQAVHMGGMHADAAGVEVWLPVQQQTRRAHLAAAVKKTFAGAKTFAARCLRLCPSCSGCSSSSRIFALQQQHFALLQHPAAGSPPAPQHAGVAATLPVGAACARRSTTAAAAAAAAAALLRLLQHLLKLFRPPPPKTVYIQCMFIPASGTHWLLPSSCCCSAEAATAASDLLPHDFSFPPSRCRHCLPVAANSQQLLQQQQQQQVLLGGGGRCAEKRELLTGGFLCHLAADVSRVQKAAFSLFMCLSRQQIAAAAASAAATASRLQPSSSTRGFARRLIVGSTPSQQQLQQHRVLMLQQQARRTLAAAALLKVGVALAAAAGEAAIQIVRQRAAGLRKCFQTQQSHRQQHRLHSSSRIGGEPTALVAAETPFRFVCGCQIPHCNACDGPGAAATAAAATGARAAAAAAAEAAADRSGIGGDIVLMFNPNAGAFEMSLAAQDPEIICYLNRGLSVILYNYRGSSSSDGSPSFPNILRDSFNLYLFAANLPGVRRIALHGRSIGGLPAAYVACLSQVQQQQQQVQFGAAAAAAAAATAPVGCSYPSMFPHEMSRSSSGISSSRTTACSTTRSNSSSSGSSSSILSAVAAESAVSAAATTAAAEEAAAECLERVSAAAAFIAANCSKIVVYTPHDEIISDEASLKTAMA